MIYAMKTTMDRAGRIVLPSAVRRELRWEGPLDLDVHAGPDGRLEIEPWSPPVRVVEGDGIFVLRAEGPVPVMTPEQEREALERDRAGRESRW